MPDLKIPDLPGTKLLRWYGRVLYNGAKMTAGPVLRRLYNVSVQGAEVIPRRGPAVIAPNHLSFIDPLCVALVVERFITFIGKAEYFDSWQTRIFFEMAGVIPVRREDSEQAQGSLAAGMGVLRSGNLLGIFPEGTRSPDGRLYKGKTGAARMALEVGCPVIPTAITGTQYILPKDARFPGIGRRVTVKFGRPVRVPTAAKDDPHLLRTFTDNVMSDIASMSKQQYRDRYAYTKRSGQPVAPVVAPFA